MDPCWDQVNFSKRLLVEKKNAQLYPLTPCISELETIHQIILQNEKLGVWRPSPSYTAALRG